MPFLSKIRLNGTLYDLKVAGDAMVTGVKGDAESDYRVGDVNITPENVGTISTEKTQSLTDTQKSTARDNLGLGSAATRSVPASGNANATQVVLGSDTRLTGSYKTDDTASTTINDTDYIPMSDSSGTKKKTLWSTIVSKIKSALGIESSGSTYLKKDGTWGTPANTTYSFATGDNNGQIKVTPSGGSAQNVSVKGLGSAAYDSTVPISHGGTGATTRLGAAQNLTNESVSSPGYVVSLTTGWANFGFTSLGHLKTAMGLGNVDNTADSSKSVNYANSAGAVAWGNVTGKPSSFTPSSHASTGTGYGAGTASNYGHVKLSDTYSSNVGGASSSIGASQSALYNVYSLLPRSHVYKDGANGGYIHPSGFTYYTITANIPKSGYYIAMINLRCYGGGTYPEYVGIFESYSILNSDASAGTIVFKEYGWQTVAVILNLTSGNNKTIVYLRNWTNSPNFNVRTTLQLLQPT